MQRHGKDFLHSASDVVNFLECSHISHLDHLNLVTPLVQAEDDEQAKLIQAKGYAHEAEYAAQLEANSDSFLDISKVATQLDAKILATLDAMKSGVEVIFQGALRDGPFFGHADFLLRVDTPSALGKFSYEVVDTKLARSVKSKFIIQLAFYSALVSKVQAVDPHLMHVMLGHRKEISFRYADFSRYFKTVQEQYLAVVAETTKNTYPHLCEKCGQCKWRTHCEGVRKADDHLSQVANITRLQIDKLQNAGTSTLAALANTAPTTTIPKLAAETFDRLRHQASLQLKARKTGERHLELLPFDAQNQRGFFRMPAPDMGDMFFDMEGDPLEEGGLEYLFGLYFFESGLPVFKPFWAHNRAEEKVAFEQFMDFVTERLRIHPSAYIFHYASYEVTALKKMMLLHGTREAEVDRLLRQSKLVDLYKVVREGMRVSEPRYSIKNIEHFYMDARAGDVQSAGASIVFYEQWKETQDPKLLKDIENYNFDDVRSTYELREWLLSLRPCGIKWFGGLEAHQSDELPTIALTEAEQRLIPYHRELMASVPDDPNDWTPLQQFNVLTYYLLDFHRRTEKPTWWSMFNRMESSEEELLDDSECIGGLLQDATNPPEIVKRSILYTYLYPEQESKIKTGDSCVRVSDGARLNELIVDHDSRRVQFKSSAKNGPMPTNMSIGLGGPISTDTLKNAIFRFADSVVEGRETYPALQRLLRQECPRVVGHKMGTVLIDEHVDLLPQIINVIANLDASAIFLQGPPGAGKTYTGSHVIVDLLKRGHKVGVSSNSHKAINNLLEGIEKVAIAEGVTFHGVKKSSATNIDTHFNGRFIKNVESNHEVTISLNGSARLVAGTAWLFADEIMDQALDYLFIDEAGQVALANLVAMGVSTKNLVLLGDQMQLAQPIQGVHPGKSGQSSLEYLLNGMATVPSEHGIFLKTTYRMHPDICRFISDAVYDGRLKPEVENAKQLLILGPDAHPQLKPTGISYIPVKHDACSQRSEEEGAIVKALFLSLLKQHFKDKSGVVKQVTSENILVIAPYNMQVNFLKQILPAEARVGTVDKFQGQEAEVVIVSMATSNGDYLPRHIEFLYSKNRLNVAISRAKCLALFVSSPDLMSIHCTTPDEIALANTMCWIKDYASGT